MLVPHTGGVMFARNDRAAVDALVAEQPFQQQGLAEIAVNELRVMSVAPGLELLRTGQQE